MKRGREREIEGMKREREREIEGMKRGREGGGDRGNEEREGEGDRGRLTGMTVPVSFTTLTTTSTFLSAVLVPLLNVPPSRVT